MDADPGKEYFIGCMIWNKVAEESNGYRFENLDILDGQQRFITLFLLHAVLRDLSTDPKLEEKVGERLKQEEDAFDNIPERNRIEFVVRQDRAFLDEWVLDPEGTLRTDELRHIEADERQPVSVRRMAGAIVDMHHWWQQRLDEIDEDEREEYLADFFGYLSNNVLALFLSTPDNLDDAYNLFTVLNSRGLQLRAADILRAQNLRHIEDDKRRHDLALRRGAGTWTPIRAPLDSFDELLMYAALSKIKFTSDKTKTLNHAFEYLVERGDMTRGEGFFKPRGPARPALPGHQHDEPADPDGGGDRLPQPLLHPVGDGGAAVRHAADPLPERVRGPLDPRLPRPPRQLDLDVVAARSADAEGPDVRADAADGRDRGRGRDP